VEVNSEGGDLLTEAVTSEANAEVKDNLTGDQGDTAQKTDDSVADDQSTSDEKPAWMAQLPGDLKDSESLTKFKNLGDLGKAYSELEGKLGSSLSIPGEEASDEERSEFYSKLGRPETPDGYNVKFPQSFSEESVKGYKDAAFGLGLNSSQLGGVVKAMSLQAIEGLEYLQNQQTSARDSGEAALKKEWGDDYEDNFKIVSRTLTRYGGDDLVKKFSAAGLGNDPDVAKFLHQVGKDQLEHRIVGGKVGPAKRVPGQLSYD